MKEPTREGLVRAIGRWDLVALAVNAIVGVGIFGLPSEVFRRVGAWSLLAFLACGMVVTLIILCFAEVSSRFAGTGGPYLYARETFGPMVGFQVGWLIWIARITAFAANCNLLIGYLGYFWPQAESPARRVMLIGAVVLGLTTVNLLGVRNATRASNVFTVAKLLPLPAAGRGRGVRPRCRATISGGEARNPRADLPRALLYAMGLVVVLYFLIQLVAIGTLPGLADSARPLADAGGRFLGPWGAAVITTGAVVSILGNLNVIVMAGSRLPFAMAEGGQLPRFLAATHPRFRTPHVAIVLTAGAALLLTLSGTFVYAATISVIARLLSYAVTCAALPVLRRRESAPAAMFRAPAGVAVAIAALVLVAWLLSHSTPGQARDAGIAAGVGLLLYLGPKVMRRVLPAFLVFLGSCKVSRQDPEPPATTDARAEVALAMEQYQRAARAVDPDSIAAFYTRTAVLFEPGIQPVHTRDSIRAFIASFPGVRLETATATPDTIEVFGDTALLWGSYFERLAFPGQPVSEQHGKFVAQWVRQRDGRWLIQRMFRVPAPSPPSPSSPRTP